MQSKSTSWGFSLTQIQRKLTRTIPIMPSLKWIYTPTQVVVYQLAPKTDGYLIEQTAQMVVNQFTTPQTKRTVENSQLTKCYASHSTKDMHVMKITHSGHGIKKILHEGTSRSGKHAISLTTISLSSGMCWLTTGTVGLTCFRGLRTAWMNFFNKTRTLMRCC